MQSEPSHRGDLSQLSSPATGHRKAMTDPASTRTRGMYGALSASSVGLELGVSVILGLAIGWFLDREFGTEPWLMLAWLAIGLAAGFRGVLRAVRRADREAAHG
jgi:ATP synthase protein I